MSPRVFPLSIVVPVYGNEGSIQELVAAIRDVQQRSGQVVEAVFVVDGSFDRSYPLLAEALPQSKFTSQLICLSRNFGSFAAIRVGLEHARGSVIAVMAADLQEPPELALKFMKALEDGAADVAFGVREVRHDPWASRWPSTFFWAAYRRLVISDVPKGGVDMFAVTNIFRDRLLLLRETNTSLLAQLFWLGGRRVFIPYVRRERTHGKSGWTFNKKMRYLADSVFAFSDLPVRILIVVGMLSLGLSVILSAVTLSAKLLGWLVVPGYAGTLLTILFFGALNSLGLGVVGTYAWRAFENTKGRPLAVVQSTELFSGAGE